MELLFVWRTWSFLIFLVFFFLQMLQLGAASSQVSKLYFIDLTLAALLEGERENPQACEKPV